LPPSLDFFWNGYVKLALLEDRQYNAPPPMTINIDQTYLARVEMESGDEFVIELLPKSAPQTVNSFVFLAQEGWFDGVTFHRVLPGFVAQTGDPTGTGAGTPGYTIPNEIDTALSHNQPGVVAMANSGPDTNGSQWYITLGDTNQLDGSYTIFGRVIEGMDIVENITPRDPSQDPTLPPGDTILHITIEVE
jgi:cyclophilin family peptidyl-prolyl cis-trans isomerase